jgi:hypothetical protein
VRNPRCGVRPGSASLRAALGRPRAPLFRERERTDQDDPREARQASATFRSAPRLGRTGRGPPAADQRNVQIVRLVPRCRRLHREGRITRCRLPRGGTRFSKNPPQPASPRPEPQSGHRSGCGIHASQCGPPGKPRETCPGVASIRTLGRGTQRRATCGGMATQRPTVESPGPRLSLPRPAVAGGVRAPAETGRENGPGPKSRLFAWNETSRIFPRDCRLPGFCAWP